MRIALLTLRQAWLEAWTNRSNFWLQIVIMLVNDLIWVIFWVVFFRRVGDLRGWDTELMLTLLAVLTTGAGISLGLLHNARRIGAMASNGELDAVLALPVHPLSHLLVRRVEPIHVGDMVFGLVLFAVYCSPTPQRTLVFVGASLCSAAICTGFLVAVGSSAFFIGRNEAGDLGFHALLLTSSYPVDVFAGAIRILLYTAVPAGFMTAVPARLVRDFDPLLALATAGVAALVVAVGVITFGRGLRRYSSGAVWTAA